MTARIDTGALGRDARGSRAPLDVTSDLQVLPAKADRDSTAAKRLLETFGDVEGLSMAEVADALGIVPS